MIAATAISSLEHGKRHLNVCMTRARHKLLLVGDSYTLCSHPFFVELLACVKGVRGYRTAHELAKQI